MRSRPRVRPSMAQVAEAAGVSVATVSNALNGTGRMSEQTRRRVMAAARDLSYVPFTTARAARRGGTGVLGLTLTTYGDLPVPSMQVPYYARLVLGATEAAHQRGHLLVVLPSSVPAWMWLTTPLDGVIHTDPRRSDPVLEILRQRGIPLVTEGRPPSPRRGDAWVDSDTDAAVRGLLDHLAGSGARRIGVVLPRHDDAYPDLVRRTYEHWCAEHEQPALVDSFEISSESTRDETAAARRLLRSRPGPDAVFGIYSGSGRNILEAAHALGLTVPDQLLVAAISEDPAYADLRPAVTTVTLHPERLAAEAVDLLLALVNGRRDVRLERLVSPDLVVRESTRPLRGGDD
jgi:DNA-binding LacI/PurR family transcriptional regulator